MYLNGQNYLITIHEAIRQIFGAVPADRDWGKTFALLVSTFSPLTSEIAISRATTCCCIFCCHSSFRSTDGTSQHIFELAYEFFWRLLYLFFTDSLDNRHIIQFQFYNLHLLSKFIRYSPKISAAAPEFLPLNCPIPTANNSFATSAFVWYHFLDFIPSYPFRRLYLEYSVF